MGSYSRVKCHILGETTFLDSLVVEIINIDRVTAKEYLFSKIRNPSNLRFKRWAPANMNP